MPKRFNYTGRKKIMEADARFRILGEGPALRFDAKLALADYKLDPQARIFVEAYRGATASLRRFDFGRVGAPVEPEERSLAAFGDPAGILFRVKVTTDGEEAGRLLAKAERIEPQTDDQPDAARSLLQTLPKELDGEAWKLSFDNGQPLLLVDPKVGGKLFAQTPEFRACAAPAIIREILFRFLVVDTDPLEDDEPETGRRRWVAFARSFTSGDCPGAGADDVEAWIDEAVAGFARRAKLVDTFLAARPSEGQP